VIDIINIFFMEMISILGMVFGVLGFVFSLNLLDKVTTLEKRLQGQAQLKANR